MGFGVYTPLEPVGERGLLGPAGSHPNRIRHTRHGAPSWANAGGSMPETHIGGTEIAPPRKQAGPSPGASSGLTE